MTARRSGRLLRLERYVFGALVLSAPTTLTARAQVRARPMAYAGVDGAGMATTLPAALRGMAAQAGVVFVGTVTGVRRVEGDGFSAVGVVEVRFAVEQGIRGVKGGSYLLREWGGLWPPGERGFVVGDRRLMLLHSPGTTGLSSPVGGVEGAIPVVGTGARVGASSRGTTAAEPMLDLRWIAAKLVQSAGAAGPSSGELTVGVGARPEVREVEPERTAAMATVEREPTLVHGSLPAGITGLTRGAQVSGWSGGTGSTLPVATAVALLRQWQGSDSVAR